MPLYKENRKINELYLGNTKISELYKGNTLVYRSSAYKPNEIVFESTTPGTYTVNLLEDGKYEITCVAGGASGVGRGDNNQQWQSSSGASGACYKGIIILSKKNYSIVVGAGGIITSWSGRIRISSERWMTATGYTGHAGGISSISGIVSCPSQKSSGHNGMYLYHINNGAPSLSVTPVSTFINKAGNNGTGGYDLATRSGAVSAYDDSTNGSGAGGNCTSISFIKMTATAGIDGYVKIVYKGR